MKEYSKKTIEIKLQVEELNKKILEIKKTRQKNKVARLEDYSLRNEKIWVDKLNLNDLQDMVLRMKKT